MGGASRERILENRMRDLVDPDNITDRPSRAGLKLIHADDQVRIALLSLVINRQHEDLETVLDQIDALRRGVEAYKKYLDKKPLKEFIPII